MVGWILIEDTNIDYPVMQTPTDPTYYLKHDFEKNYTDYGCPFMQADCDALAPSDNLILYGHNMKDGSMFADLAKYRSKDFWQSHKTVWFDTALGSCAYEIFAVIHTTVQADTADAFPFYRFVDAATPEESPAPDSAQATPGGSRSPADRGSSRRAAKIPASGSGSWPGLRPTGPTAK